MTTRDTFHLLKFHLRGSCHSYLCLARYRRLTANQHVGDAPSALGCLPKYNASKSLSLRCVCLKCLSLAIPISMTHGKTGQKLLYFEAKFNQELNLEQLKHVTTLQTKFLPKKSQLEVHLLVIWFRQEDLASFFFLWGWGGVGGIFGFQSQHCYDRSAHSWFI